MSSAVQRWELRSLLVSSSSTVWSDPAWFLLDYCFAKSFTTVLQDLKSDSMLCRQGYLNDIMGVFIRDCDYELQPHYHSRVSVCATSGRQLQPPPMRQIGEGSSGCIFALSGYDSEQGDLQRCFVMLPTFIPQEISNQIAIAEFENV